METHLTLHLEKKQRLGWPFACFSQEISLFWTQSPVLLLFVNFLLFFDFFQRNTTVLTRKYGTGFDNFLKQQRELFRKTRLKKREFGKSNQIEPSNQWKTVVRKKLLKIIQFPKKVLVSDILQKTRYLTYA